MNVPSVLSPSNIGDMKPLDTAVLPIVANNWVFAKASLTDTFNFQVSEERVMLRVDVER